MKFFDLEGRGQVKLSEFIFAIQFFVVTKQETRLMPEIKFLFTRLDQDESGFVDAEKLAVLFEPSNCMLIKTGRQVPCRADAKRASPLGLPQFNPFTTSYGDAFKSPSAMQKSFEFQSSPLEEHSNSNNFEKIAMKDCEILDLPLFQSIRRENFAKLKSGGPKDRKTCTKPVRKLQILGSDKAMSKLESAVSKSLSVQSSNRCQTTKNVARNASLQYYLSEMNSESSR